MHGMLALALCWSAALQQTPLFRSGTELATLEVTVVDGKGHVVTGLGRDDFVITIENRPASVQAVTFVNVDQAAPAVTAPAVTPGASAPAAAPAPTGASAPYRVIVIVVDDLSFPPGPLLASVKPALDLLPLLDTNDLVGLVTTSGLGPVVNPTRDRDAVRKALLDKSSTGRAGREPMGPYFIGAEEAIDIDHGTTQVSKTSPIASANSSASRNRSARARSNRRRKTSPARISITPRSSFRRTRASRTHSRAVHPRKSCSP